MYPATMDTVFRALPSHHGYSVQSIFVCLLWCEGSPLRFSCCICLMQLHTCTQMYPATMDTVFRALPSHHGYSVQSIFVCLLWCEGSPLRFSCCICLMQLHTCTQMYPATMDTVFRALPSHHGYSVQSIFLTLLWCEDSPLIFCCCI